MRSNEFSRLAVLFSGYLLSFVAVGLIGKGVEPLLPAIVGAGGLTVALFASTRDLVGGQTVQK